MKILLAEDDAFFQTFYSKKLAEKGFEVVVAKDGAVALQALNNFKPDLILLDLIMPVKDGFDVLTELSKNDIIKNIPVLVFSTLGQESDIEKAIQLGAKGYVNKTFFDFDNLLFKINSVINR